MSGGGGGGGSAVAGGSFSAGTPRGAPLTEPPSLSQYLSLDPLPVGDHKHSRAAELRRALADSAEPPFALRPLPPAVAEELRRIRGGVAESSARAKYTLLLALHLLAIHCPHCSVGSLVLK
jgi:hypothetical protein